MSFSNNLCTVGMLLLLLLDKKEGDGASHMVVMPAPSKRGRKKKATLSMVGPGGGPGNETFILAHLAPGGQVSFNTWSSKSKIFSVQVY